MLQTKQETVTTFHSSLSITTNGKENDSYSNENNNSDNGLEEVPVDSEAVLSDLEEQQQDDTKTKIPREQAILIKMLVITCSILAWACVVFVPVWKIVDTSYLFRERDDPSLFDQVTDYFGSESCQWPYCRFIESGKDTYRVYFFIMPFVLAFFLVAVKGTVAAKYKKKMSLPKFQLPNVFRYHGKFGLTTLDCFLITATLVYSALLLWVRMKRCLAQGRKRLTFLYEKDENPIPAPSWEATEIMAKSLGVLTIVLLGWFVLMPIGRRSVLLQVFGIPWDAAIKYHRWLGWYTLAALLAHTFTYIAVWIYATGDPKYDPEGVLLRHMMVPGSCNDGSCDYKLRKKTAETLHYEMMYGFASLFVMIVMSVFAIHYVRRRYFEVFYYTHQLFRLMIIFLCLHYAKTMLYLLPGVAMIIIDKTIGYLSFLGTTKAAAHAVTKDIVELRIRKDPKTCCEPGQYVFINVPSVSVLEWHPITVTWSTETELAVHIKSRGPGTWTQSVLNDVCAWGGQSLSIKMDGFYGPNQIENHNLLNRKAVVLFCGGCALTFPFSIIMELCRADPTLPVYLRWVTRTREEYDAFEGLLCDIQNRFKNLSVSAWVTLRGQPNCDDDSGHDSLLRPTSTKGTSFFPASTPDPKSVFCTTDGTGRKQYSPWRPWPSWLWPTFIHAGITAIAILVGTLGYSLSRQHETKTEESLKPEKPSTHMIMTFRFLDFLFAVLITACLLLVLIGLRLAWATWKHKIANSHPKQFSKEDVSSHSLSDSDSYSVELGPMPISTCFGRRPDMEDTFESLAKEHPNNVTILACGPNSMVNAIKKECQKFVWDSWIVSAEEWEW